MDYDNDDESSKYGNQLKSSKQWILERKFMHTDVHTNTLFTDMIHIDTHKIYTVCKDIDRY